MKVPGKHLTATIRFSWDCRVSGVQQHYCMAPLFFLSWLPSSLNPSTVNPACVSALLTLCTLLHSAQPCSTWTCIWCVHWLILSLSLSFFLSHASFYIFYHAFTCMLTLSFHKTEMIFKMCLGSLVLPALFLMPATLWKCAYGSDFIFPPTLPPFFYSISQSSCFLSPFLPRPLCPPLPPPLIRSLSLTTASQTFQKTTASLPTPRPHTLSGPPPQTCPLLSLISSWLISNTFWRTRSPLKPSQAPKQKDQRLWGSRRAARLKPEQRLNNRAGSLSGLFLNVFHWFCVFCPCWDRIVATMWPQKFTQEWRSWARSPRLFQGSLQVTDL